MIKKIDLYFRKTYKYIIGILIFFMYLIISFNNLFVKSDNVSAFGNILFLIIASLVFLVINKLFLNKLSDKWLKIVSILLFCIFIIFELITVLFLRVKYNWDFGWIMKTAEELTNKGYTNNVYYFKIFPNNLGALTIVYLSMKIFFGKTAGAYFINCIFVFLTVLFTVLSAKEMFGLKFSVNTLVLLVLCAPLYLYVPIVYTDTLSVLFPVLELYIWLLIKRMEMPKRRIILSIILGIVTTIGFCIKPVAAIVFIAIIIDALIEKRKYLKDIIIALLIFLILKFSYNTVMYKVFLKDNPKNNFEYPYTHWIMMGLNPPESEGGTSIGYGAYSSDDVSHTSSIEKYEDKVAYNKKIIKERLSSFGFKGYLDFLYKKFRYIWCDGSFYVLNKIGWDTINKDTIVYDYVLGEHSYYTIRPYMSYFYFFISVYILVGIIFSLRNKNDNIRIIYLSIIGIAVFLLFWEARSRYIYFMIPLFIIAAMYGIEYLLDINIKRYFEKIKTYFKRN